MYLVGHQPLEDGVEFEVQRDDDLAVHTVSESSLAMPRAIIIPLCLECKCFFMAEVLPPLRLTRPALPVQSLHRAHSLSLWSITESSHTALSTFDFLAVGSPDSPPLVG